MNDFTLSSGMIFADCEIKSGNPVSAQIGHGAYILNVPITFNVRPFTESKLLINVAGTIYINSRFFANLRSLDGDVSINASDKYQLSHQKHFGALFSAAALKSIEDQRASGELHLQMKLFGTILSVQDNNGHAIDATKVTAEILHRIPQSEWLGFLNSWKYAPAMNIELVIHSESPILSKAGEFIRQAQSFYLNNQWPQVLSECRKAIDVILEYLKSENASLGELVKSKHRNGLRERILVSILSLKQICDPAVHGDGNSTEQKWTQADALYVIRLGASLLDRVSKLKPEYSDALGQSKSEATL